MTNLSAEHAARNSQEQHSVFIRLLCTSPDAISLFLRLVVFVAMKRTSLQVFLQATLEERVRRSFQKGIQFMSSLNPASDAPSSPASKVTNENNSHFCTYCIRLIALEHESHNDLVNLLQELPIFTLRDRIKIDGVYREFKQLIPIDPFRDLIAHGNEQSFMHFFDCRRSTLRGHPPP